MGSDTFTLVLLVAPLLVAGLIAAVNSEASNGTTERVEAWVRAHQQGTSASKGWFLGYVVNPVLWTIVKFCDWTDDFTHRGLKNGTRVAAALYLIAAWLFLLYIAVMVVVAVVIVVVAIYVALKMFGEGMKSMNSSGDDTDRDRSSSYDSVRGSKSYRKTGMFSEDEAGRTDEEGRIFKKTGMFSEEEIGRIAEDGTTFKKTGMFAEEETGRRDEEGRVFRKTGMFSEEEVGRVDADGRVFKKTGMFSEEETGRIEKE